jgi:hypothetical protein
MVPPLALHKFNNDLLLEEHDRKLAARKYPTILHVLDHPELRQLFLQYDEPANRAKRNGRIAGLAAIAFGFMALAIAALEYPMTHQPDGRYDFLRLPLAASSAVCGIVCVLIGSIGVLFARRKREWLHHRLMGERIRRFHLQTLVYRLPEILISMKGNAAKAAFTVERALWFENFTTWCVGTLDAAFVDMIREDNDGERWLHEGRRELPKLRESKDLEPLFDAYRELRILHQIGYANYKLQSDYKILSDMPGRQAQILSNISFIAIALLCVIHVGVLWDALLHDSVWRVFASDRINVVIYVVTIWIALAALAVRAIEQGLQPEREVERYQQYRSALRAILDRFDRAETQSEKIQIMEEMERLSFDELRNFLITNERAKFVM